jgi:hypothetical protein
LKAEDLDEIKYKKLAATFGISPEEFDSNNQTIGIKEAPKVIELDLGFLSKEPPSDTYE